MTQYPPSLHRVRRDRSPASPPHFVSFAWRYHLHPALFIFVLCFRTSRRSSSASARRARGLLHRLPLPASQGWRQQALPGSWMTLPRICPALRPRRNRFCQALQQPGAAPTTRTAKAPAIFSLSRLNHAASAIATYASRLGHPSPRKAHFRLLATLCRTGLVTCMVTMKGFRIPSPPLPGFTWRNRDLNFKKSLKRQKLNIIQEVSALGTTLSLCSSVNYQVKIVCKASKQA